MKLPIYFYVFFLFFFVAAPTVSGQAEPPVDANLNRPVKIISQPAAAYTSKARSKNVEGAVRLKIELLASGEVGTVTLVKTKGWERLQKYGLVQRAIKAAKQIEFTPKVVNGQPVSIVVTREYTFSIY